MQPCDEGVMLSTPAAAPCSAGAAPWILAATILGSSLAFIDGSVVNLALPAFQGELCATVIDAEWVVEAYVLRRNMGLTRNRWGFRDKPNSDNGIENHAAE